MNLSEFRTAHSIVMELIEMHLEGIYAALNGRSFYEGLKILLYQFIEKYGLDKLKL